MHVENVSIIGLGKLGASMLAAIAARGMNVIGVDIRAEAVKAVNEGLAPVQETDLDKYIKANKDRIRATMSHDEAIAESDISFVIVPTPSDSKGAFSLQYAAYAFADLGRALKKKQGYHVIVLTSTVLPGATRYGLLPILEKESGKLCGPDFGLCYNPEFIALGSVIRDFLNPDFYLLGEFDEKSVDVLAGVHNQVSENRAPVKRMSLENAELVKISINSFITMKISFANMIAEFAEKIPGGNVDIVSNAMGMDGRIGRKYLTGGMSFGGPCFPRDNVALGFLGKVLDVECGLPETTNTFNKNFTARFVEKIKNRLEPHSTVAVLGLAYKPHSHVVEESPGIALCKELSSAGFRVLAYDPLAGETADPILKYHVMVTRSLQESLKDAQTIMVTTCDPLFLRLTAADILGDKKKVTVVDFWRAMCLEIVNHPNIIYIPVGCCIEDIAAKNVLESLWQN
ncbi:MAG: UDP-glucose/GDP-mannose dehydrogenase family protein [Desulfamplus sp.]|nr:UDP-glucose/GDP-mannose dehydrogenase family protein [Desulfamplus sp.]